MTTRPRQGARPPRPPSAGDPGGRVGRIVVRSIEQADHAAAGAIVAGSYLAFPDVADDAEYLAELRDVGARAAAVPVFVAADAETGTILGCVTYVPGPGPLAEGEEPDDAGIRMLAVAPEARGRGAGRLLVEACIDRARHDGKRRILLYTLPAMTAAHRLYEGLGFVRDPGRDWEYEPGKRLLGYRLELPPDGPS